MPVFGTLSGARGFGRGNSVSTNSFVASFGSVGADIGRNIVVDSTNSKIYVGEEWSSSRAGIMHLNFSPTNTTLTLGTTMNFRPGARTSGTNGYGHAVDSSGNIYLCGNQSTDGNWLLKVNSSYTYQWTKRLTGAGTSFNSMGVDSSGNVYALSNSNYLVKYNSSGTIQWQRVLTLSASTLSNKQGKSLFVTGAGDCYLALNDDTLSDAYIVKYNTSGTLQYQKRLGIGLPTAIHAITVNSSGEVFVAGATTVSSVDNVFWAKYNSSGTYQYSRRIAVNATTENCHILISSNQDVYVLGTRLSGGNLLAKYDASGNLTWQRSIGGTNSPVLYGIGEDSSYQIYAVGYRTHTTPSNRGSDVVLVRLSSAGSPTGTYSHRTTGISITASSYTATSGTATTNTNGSLTSSTGAATDTTPSESANFATESNFAGSLVTTVLTA